jgi:hypothetical protein
MNNLLKQNETNKDGIIMQTYMKVNQYKLQRYVEENNIFAVIPYKVQRYVVENNIFVVIPYKVQRYVVENNIFAVMPYYKDVCCDLLRLSIIISNFIISFNKDNEQQVLFMPKVTIIYSS